MNGWYDRIVGGIPQNPVPVFQNPIQKAAYIMRAMSNPVAFVKSQFPDIPDGIMNDPVQVRNYIQKTRGISDQQLQQIINQYPGP